MKIIKTILFFAACVCGTASTSQERLTVTSSIADMPLPSRVLAMLPGTDNFVAERHGSWGDLNVAEGTYEIMVIPTGANALPIRFGPITVDSDQANRIDIDSAIRFVSRNNLPPLDVWVVGKHASDQAAAQVVDRWGLTPLPPGQYTIDVPLPGDMVEHGPVTVTAGQVTEVTLADVGLGRVSLGMPDADDVVFLFGGGPLIPLMQEEGEWYDMSRQRAGGNVALWRRAGPVVLERRSGSFADRHEPVIVSGEEVALPFDATALAEAHSLSVFQSASIEVIDRLNVVTAQGDRVLFSGPVPAADPLFLAPGGVRIALQKNGSSTPYQDMPVGMSDAVGTSDESNVRQNDVSLAVQSPLDGDEYDSDTDVVRVVGQASSTATAGVTKLALVVDISASTTDPSGRDIDGDGQIDSILAAELRAGAILVDKLVALENDLPGTQFAVGIVAFGDSAQAMTPLLRLDDENAVGQLQRAMKGLSAGALGGSTFYDRALDAADRLIARDAAQGPSVAILITDGKPSDPVAGIDAAGRLGLSNTTLHAIGLGPEFQASVPNNVDYPPLPDDGPSVLAIMAQLAGANSQTWALPKPSDVVDLIPSLPILERGSAEIALLEVYNETIDQSTDTVVLRQDGSFEAVVPVSFLRAEGGAPVNTLRVTAMSQEGQTAAKTVRLIALGQSEEELQLAAAAQADADTEITQLRAALAEANATATKKIAELEQTVAQAQAELGNVADLRASANQCTIAQNTCAADLDAALTQLLDVRPEPTGLVLTVPGDVLFDFNDSKIVGSSEQALRLASLYLRNHEKADLMVEGHTDAIGSTDYNAQLSADRAQSVADWLVNEADIPPERIRAVLGLGETKPLAAETLSDGSDDPQGRQQNRRVEIRILK